MISSIYSKQQLGFRYIILFLLFALALHQLYTAQLAGMAMVAAIPAVIIVVAAILKWTDALFWTLMLVNYFVMFSSREGWLHGIPASLPNEMLQIGLIILALLNPDKYNFDKTATFMNVVMSTWVGFICIEAFNDTLGLGFNFGAWYNGARLMAFQLLYCTLVMNLYVNNPSKTIKFIRVWAFFTLFATYWSWKQINMGWDDAEKRWLITAARTHMVNGIVRYPSVFTDAANAGCHLGAVTALFGIAAITSKIRWDRILFGLTSCCALWTMFQTGTRTAIFCLIAAIMVYIVLSKNIRIMVPVTTFLIIGVIILGFTTIGDSNTTIHRMRTAFDKNDASAGVREHNKGLLKKHLQDAPWGIGVGIFTRDIPAWHKYKRVSEIPPDSEYVFIWVRTGVVGLTVFLLLTFLAWFGACCIVFFQLRSRSLAGLGAGICSAFVAIQLGGYGNQILMQFPNVMLFYGSLALVYVFPRFEEEWEQLENKRFAEQKPIKILGKEIKLLNKL